MAAATTLRKKSSSLAETVYLTSSSSAERGCDKKRDAVLPRFMTTTQSLAPCYSPLPVHHLPQLVYNPSHGLGSETSSYHPTQTPRIASEFPAVSKRRSKTKLFKVQGPSSHLVPAPPLGYVVCVCAFAPPKPPPVMSPHLVPDISALHDMWQPS